MKQGVYQRFFKRAIDIASVLLFFLCFGWLLLLLALLVRVKIGSPVLFKQVRPGQGEKLFWLYKFRTMTNETDADGKLLPDEKRLTPFGKWLRSTSLDELPELWNILRGDMSLIGPRPQLVRDMVFMTNKQRLRHIVRPGLSGWAQVNGRNAVAWEEKLRFDLEYLQRMSFSFDTLILVRTLQKVVQREGINEEGMETAEDFGDYLLRTGKVTQSEYDAKQAQAEELLRHV